MSSDPRPHGSSHEGTPPRGRSPKRRDIYLARSSSGEPLGIMVFLTASDLRSWGVNLDANTVTVVYTSSGLDAG